VSLPVRMTSSTRVRALAAREDPYLLRPAFQLVAAGPFAQQPSAIAHARSTRTRPRSWPPAGDGSAADSPPVRPGRHATPRPCRRTSLQDRATNL
jgi:hypothetical protein